MHPIPPLAAIDGVALTISALFGLAQVGAGGALLRRFAQLPDWRNPARFLGAVAGIWLVTSGIAELAVAGAEVGSGGLVGTALRVKGVADAILLTVTALALLVALAYPLARRYDKA